MNRTNRNNGRKQQSRRDPANNYRPSRVAAVRLEAGESLWLSQTRIPETSDLIKLGEHFRWWTPGCKKPDGLPLPEFRGRGDKASHVLFTAAVALLVSLHEPWDSLTGGVTIGHIRTARASADMFGVVETLPHEVFVKSPDFKVFRSLWENNHPKHLSAGGPQYCIAYVDERVIPAFKYSKGATTPYAWILHVEELPSVLLAFYQQARVNRAVVEDQYERGSSKLGTAAPSALKYDEVDFSERVRGTRREVNRVLRIGFEPATGRIGRLEVDGSKTASVMVAPGVVLTVSTVIQEPGIRRMLGLPSLETGMVEAPPPVMHYLQEINPVIAAFTDAEKIAALTPRNVTPPPVNGVPRVERRAKPPKLGDLVISAEVVPAPVVEEVAQAAEPVVEEVAQAAEPVVEEVAQAAEPVSEPVVEEVVEEVAQAAELVAPEIVADVDPQDLTELEMHRLLHLIGQLPEMIGSEFQNDVLTGDGRVIILAGDKVAHQHLVNLVYHREGVTGNEEELLLIRMALEEGDASFVPGPDPDPKRAAYRRTFDPTRA